MTSAILTTLKQRIRQSLVERLDVPEMAPALSRLRGQGFQPELIVDVGAYHGEFAILCRRYWPRARIACVEPQERAVERLEAVMSHDDLVIVHRTLLGASQNESVVFHEAETASSVLTEHIEQHHPRVNHQMTTLAQLVQNELDGEPPGFLKLDVQGYELEVLKGAEKVLAEVEVILTEVNLIDIHRGAPLLSDLVAWLAAHGFVAFDLCGITRRPLDGALWQADLLFVPENSPLRLDKRWAA